MNRVLPPPSQRYGLEPGWGMIGLPFFFLSSLPRFLFPLQKRIVSRHLNPPPFAVLFFQVARWKDTKIPLFSLPSPLPSSSRKKDARKGDQHEAFPQRVRPPFPPPPLSSEEGCEKEGVKNTMIGQPKTPSQHSVASAPRPFSFLFSPPLPFFFPFQPSQFSQQGPPPPPPNCVCSKPPPPPPLLFANIKKAGKGCQFAANLFPSHVLLAGFSPFALPSFLPPPPYPQTARVTETGKKLLTGGENFFSFSPHTWLG